MHGRRQHVRGVVADQLERLVAAAVGDDLELGGAPCRRSARDQRSREVARLAVDLDGERRARKPGADRGRRVGAGRARHEGEDFAVGELVLHRTVIVAALQARVVAAPKLDALCSSLPAWSRARTTIERAVRGQPGVLNEVTPGAVVHVGVRMFSPPAVGDS